MTRLWAEAHAIAIHFYRNQFPTTNSGYLVNDTYSFKHFLVGSKNKKESTRKLYVLNYKYAQTTLSASQQFCGALKERNEWIKTVWPSQPVTNRYHMWQAIFYQPCNYTWMRIASRMLKSTFQQCRERDYQLKRTVQAIWPQLPSPLKVCRPYTITCTCCTFTLSTNAESIPIMWFLSDHSHIAESSLVLATIV